MANNRMMLKCKVCGKTKVIAKRGLGEYREYRPNRNIERSLNEFYLDHWLCAIGSDNDEIDSDNTFELVYEF